MNDRHILDTFLVHFTTGKLVFVSLKVNREKVGINLFFLNTWKG